MEYPGMITLLSDLMDFFGDIIDFYADAIGSIFE